MADKRGRMRGAFSDISKAYTGGQGVGILGGIADIAAVYGTRKLVTFAWTRATGKEPPSNPDDLQVRLPEALAWAVTTGVAISAARLLAGRALARRLHSKADGGGAG